MIACGDVIETVLHRARDPHGTGTNREFVRTLLNHVQLLVNTKLGLVTSERPHVMKPFQQVYGLISELYPEIARIVSIHYGSLDLPMTDWRRLHHYDRRWFRALGNEPKVWSPLGRDSFIVHPGVDHELTVTLHYSIIPTLLTSDDQVMEIPDQHLPLVYDFLEALLLTKNRSLTGEDRAILDAVFSRSLGRFKVDAKS